MSAAQHRLALPSGYQLGRYQFKEMLGCGGFGITYLAEDTTLGRKVAIKELLPNDIATRIDGTTVVAKTKSEEESLTWARERFVGEGRALAACDHPNVMNVYEMVEANGTAYMVTKYQEGQNLDQWLRQLNRPPNESELRRILTPLLSGLDAVHNAGFLHRDIKPENIYITKNGRPVLLDFGSARQAISSRSMALTSVVSTGYAPFEQYHEDGNQGPWSDIYALAAVMYRAISGRKPPEATRRLKDDPIEKLTARYAGKYDAEFLRAIDKALAVDETRRPKTVAEWKEMFGPEDRLPLDGDETRLLPRRKKAKAWTQTWEPLLQSPRALTMGAGAVLVLLLGVLWVITRPKPHDSGSQTQDTVVAVSPIPTPESSQPAEASPAPTVELKPTAQEEIVGASPTPAPSPELSLTPSLGFQLDPQLVGTWETKGRWPPNSTRTRTAHWSMQDDGHFTFSGPWSDTGTITATDGKMKWFSNNAAQPVDITYEFNGDTLVTHGPLGDAQWTRTRPSTQQSSRSRTRKRSSEQGDNVRRKIFRRVFRHFP